jgi:hypothetical protein
MICTMGMYVLLAKGARPAALCVGCSVRLQAHGRVTAPEGARGRALRALQGRSTAMILQDQALI